MEQRTYREALHLEADVSPVISIVGAGGKTTTIRRLAQEYADAGWKVAVTTTTHMQIETRSCFLLDESMKQLQKIMEQERQVWFGVPAPIKKTDNVKKMQAVSEDFFDKYWNCGFRFCLSRRHPGAYHVKHPEIESRCYEKETTDVLAVYGLDAIGKSIQEVVLTGEDSRNFAEKTVGPSMCRRYSSACNEC